MAQFDWRPCFPLHEPREQQVTALNFITEQYLAGNELVVSELGTGVGKSAIAITLATWLRTYEADLIAKGIILPNPQTYVLTSQKILQDQYARDFASIAKDLRSSANFQCQWVAGQSCAETMRIERALRASKVGSAVDCGSVCPYRESKEAFLAATVGVTNYSYFLSETVYAGALGQRELLIFDECLPGDAKIWVHDDVEVNIREIYHNQDITHVTSFNESTNSYEQKRIIRRTRTSYDKDTQWIEIHVHTDDHQSVLLVTDNHKIWTKNRGYVRADELTCQDTLKFDTLQKHNLSKHYVATRSGKSSGRSRREKTATCPTCKKIYTDSGLKLHLSRINEIRDCQGDNCSNKIEISKTTGSSKRYCSIQCHLFSTKMRNQTSVRMNTNNPSKLPGVAAKAAATWKYNWQHIRSEESKSAQLQRFKNAPLHENRIRPNKLEQMIIDLKVSGVIFTGLGDKWVTFKNGKHKNPDFIVENTNKIIEVGDVTYWHSVEEIRDVVQHYSEIGYDCLYVTNKQLFEDYDATVASIRKFVHNHDVIIDKLIKRTNLSHRDKFKYNIEVEKNHNYFANSVLVSNCHHVEDEIRKWATSSISRNVSMRLLGVKFPAKNSTPSYVVKWIEHEYAPAAMRLLAKTMGSIKSGVAKRAHLLKPELIRELAHKYEWLDKHVCQLNRYLESDERARNNYLLEREESKDDEHINVKPLDVTPHVHDLLFSKGRKKLLMSATILDEATFCRNNGVPRSKMAFISIPTPFKPEAFGIVFEPAGKMSRKFQEATVPIMVTKIKRILEAHPDLKGVIHTVSYAVLNELKKINNDRLLFQQSGEPAADLIKKHISSPGPTVLVSPAMMEGVDLYDDLGRLQIICKVPYPYIGDPVVAAKLERDPTWYSWRTVMSIVQAIGRCVRSENDWAYTYILDECFGDLFMKWNRMFPEHFKNMQVIGG